VPELPEVETVARQLAPQVEGRRIVSVGIVDPKLEHAALHRDLPGARIRDCGRMGKQVVLRLDTARGGRRWLCIHLRMTGRLRVLEAAPGPVALPLRAVLELDRGWLTFVDPRRFGTLRLADRRSGAAPPGAEPLSRAFTAASLTALLGRSRQPLKPWLLRQDRITGLGNIYASEILFVSRLSPERAAGSLDAGEIRRLHRAIRSVLRAAISACGTTFSDFQDARGVEGSYARYLTVYGREDQPCRRCRTPIRRGVQQQRATYWCPRCQGTRQP